VVRGTNAPILMTFKNYVPAVNAPADRLAGLDGLRAVAVTLVVLFHLGAGVLPGGYIGVDIFFPISGFLITLLLLRERLASGGVDVLQFWQRRARRLLPALAVVLLVCSAVAFVIGGDVLVGIGRQVLGASTFSYNWLAIAQGASYLDATTPELFRNLWSLAVEEQFYLVWPVLVILLWVVPSRWFRLGFVLTVAVASAVLMGALFAGGDTTRVYYGTDTHSFGLALGAALAIARQDWPGFAVARSRGDRALGGLIGLLAIGGLVALAFTLRADGASAYRGGLALVAALSVVAIATATVPGGLLGRALDLQPLKWIGQRSYGIYLWHWPVFVLVAGAAPVGDPTPEAPWIVGGVALAITLLASTLSYAFVEAPIRRQGFRSSARVFVLQWRRDRWGVRRGAWLRASIVAAALVTVTTLTVGAVASDPGDGMAAARIRAGAAAIAAAEARASATPTPPPTLEPSMPRGDQMVAIGDSVMLAVAPELTAAFPGITVDAVVSRQMRSAPEIVKSMVEAKTMKPFLVLGLGTNGPIDVDTLQQIKQIVGRRTEIVLVNVQAPRGWTPGNNEILGDYAQRLRTVELADWHAAIQPHLDVLAGDQIHAGGAVGGGIYVDALKAALLRLVEQPEVTGGPHESGDKPAER
jgi:peptidoglycan/LPS O-acetylase OafA/YrhL